MATPPSRARPPILFKTFCVPASKSCKLIHGEPTITLEKFLETFRFKHQIPLNKSLTDIQVTLDDNTIELNLEDTEREWDWIVIMEQYAVLETAVKREPVRVTIRVE